MSYISKPFILIVCLIYLNHFSSLIYLIFSRYYKNYRSLSRFPIHLSLFSIISIMLSFLSHLVLPHIQCNILIYVVHILFFCWFLTVQHSILYNIAGLIVIRNFPFNLMVSPYHIKHFFINTLEQDSLL